MFYNFFAPYADQFIFFNLFRYLTFRAGAATLTAMVICFVIAPPLIRWLRRLGDQPLREIGPAHAHKRGTPTMGGLMMLISVFISTLLWVDLSNTYTWVVLLVTVGYGLIGFADDYLKLTKKNHHGVKGRIRLSLQLVIGLIAAYFLMRANASTAFNPELATSVPVPFFNNILLPLGLFIIPFAALVMAGSANAVNITDGLDGLATVPIALAAGSFGIIAYLVGNVVFATYLGVNHVPGTGELAVFCGALVGACLGFLWHNAPPAAVFMGDTGSLSLGGAIGTVAVATKHELVLAIIGGLFVVETASVMIQVASFKLTGKRVFRMAPLHHHFEKLGWSEPTVVIRFWIVAFILALIGLSTLKLR